MFSYNQKKYRRLVGLLCFFIFGYSFSQDQGPNDAIDEESISEKDAKEEKEIKDLFFNEEKEVTNNEVSDLQSEDALINARLQALKERILQLELEKKRIELVLLEKEAQLLQTSIQKKESEISKMPSTVLLTPKVIENEESFYKTEKLIIPEEETQTLVRKQPNRVENENDLSRTLSYTKGVATFAVTPNNESFQNKKTIVIPDEDTSNTMSPNTYLVKETIDTSSVGAFKIHRVFVEKIGEEEADQALKNKTKTAASFKGAVRSSVAATQKVKADFNGDSIKFYAHISSVDVASECTTIHFENENCTPLVVFNTMGGSLSSLSLPGSDRDFLLFSAAINKNEFTRYFLFVLRNNEWKPVVTSFAIHKSNQIETEALIRIDPNNHTKLLRYYSVFDLDESQESINPWKLREESVSKIAW